MEDVSDGGGVRKHAGGSGYGGEVSAGDGGGCLVVNATLKACGERYEKVFVNEKVTHTHRERHTDT